MKKTQPLYTFEKFLISIKILNPLGKVFNSLEVTSRTPSPRKSQFHPSRNNSNPSRKYLNLPEKFLPTFPFSKNSLTITETTSNIRTKSQPLQKKSQPLGKKISTPHPPPQKKISTFPENFSIPLIIF